MRRYRKLNQDKLKKYILLLIEILIIILLIINILVPIIYWKINNIFYGNIFLFNSAQTLFLKGFVFIIYSILVIFTYYCHKIYKKDEEFNFIHAVLIILVIIHIISSLFTLYFINNLFIG